MRVKIPALANVIVVLAPQAATMKNIAHIAMIHFKKLTNSFDNVCPFLDLNVILAYNEIKNAKTTAIPMIKIVWHKFGIALWIK